MIPFSFFSKHNIEIKGVLHIGAHKAEEEEQYFVLGLSRNNIIWVEAIPDLAKNLKNEAQDRIVCNALISNIDGEIRDFIITNNMQSSSLLELEEHKIEHPWVFEVNRIKMRTNTIDTLFYNELKRGEINMLYMDIQGAELLALQGAEKSLEYINVIYTEVNIKKLYKDCALLSDLDTFLDKKGYVRVELNLTDHGWGDAIYLKY